MSSGDYGPPGGYPAGPPPRRSSARQAAPWVVSAAVTVLAAAVVIALVLTGGSTGSPVADGTSPPASNGTGAGPSNLTNTSISAPATGAPTTDVLPSNSGSGSCGKGVQPGLVAVSVATVLGLSTKGSAPEPFTANVLRDCTSAAIRSRIEVLFGVQFGTDYSGDLTGSNDAGPTAMYRVSNLAGTGTLTLTLTRQQDGHYEVTGFSYSG